MPIMERMRKTCPKCGKKWTDHYLVGSVLVPEGTREIGTGCWADFDKVK